MRLAQKAERQASYTAATADAVKDLPRRDRLATAMLQVLHTTPWLEMKDHWDLTGEQMARVTGWARARAIKGSDVSQSERRKLPLPRPTS